MLSWILQSVRLILTSQRACQVEKVIQALRMVHPCDRNGAVLKDRLSSAELDASLEAYRQACAHTAEQVQAQLKALARRLMVSAPSRGRRMVSCPEHPATCWPCQAQLCDASATAAAGRVGSFLLRGSKVLVW
jgi:hypothetical protein